MKKRDYKRLALYYGPDARINDIPARMARRLGKSLLDSDYRRMASYLVNVEKTNFAVKDAIRDMDADVRYQKNTAEELSTSDKIIGPYYVNDEQGEFYQPGIAIWSREQREAR